MIWLERLLTLSLICSFSVFIISGVVSQSSLFHIHRGLSDHHVVFHDLLSGLVFFSVGVEA